MKIGDIEKTLPHGMYLHKMYDHRKSQSVVKLQPTNLYMQRKNMLLEQADAIQEQRKKMAMTMMQERQKKDQGAAQKKKPVKHVPQVVTSAKFIMQEKKESEKAEGKGK